MATCVTILCMMGLFVGSSYVPMDLHVEEKDGYIGCRSIPTCLLLSFHYQSLDQKTIGDAKERLRQEKLCAYFYWRFPMLHAFILQHSGTFFILRITMRLSLPNKHYY